MCARECFATSFKYSPINWPIPVRLDLFINGIWAKKTRRYGRIEEMRKNEKKIFDSSHSQRCYKRRNSTYQGNRSILDVDGIRQAQQVSEREKRKLLEKKAFIRVHYTAIIPAKFYKWKKIKFTWEKNLKTLKIFSLGIYFY